MKKKHNPLAIKSYITIVLLQICLLPIVVSCGNSEVVDSDIYGPWEMLYVDTTHTVCSNKNNTLAPRETALELQRMLQEMLVGFNARSPNNKANSIIFGGVNVDDLASKIIWDFSNANVINIGVYGYSTEKFTNAYVEDQTLIIETESPIRSTHSSRKPTKYKLVDGDIYWEKGVDFDGPFKIHLENKKMELINRHDDVSCQDGGEVERRYVFLRK